MSIQEVTFRIVDALKELGEVKKINNMVFLEQAQNLKALSLSLFRWHALGAFLACKIQDLCTLFAAYRR